jgi:hypothetical protein
MPDNLAASSMETTKEALTTIFSRPRPVELFASAMRAVSPSILELVPISMTATFRTTPLRLTQRTSSVIHLSPSTTTRRSVRWFSRFLWTHISSRDAVRISRIHLFSNQPKLLQFHSDGSYSQHHGTLLFSGPCLCRGVVG